MKEFKFRFFATDKSRMIYPKFLKFSGTDLEENDTWKVMQYTGLKDKNGKEIYEGDILYNLNDRYNYVIIWDDIQGAFSLGEDGCLLKKYCLNEFCEVIGNIYENPELLEAK